MTTERPRFILQIAVSPFGERVGWAAHVIGADSNQCHIMMAELLTKLKLPHQFGVIHDMAMKSANMGIGVWGSTMWLGSYLAHTEKAGFVVNLTTERIR